MTTGGKKKVALVGGSAGSLEPLGEIIDSIAQDSRLSIILVQHLDPRKKSSLLELLKHRTTMPAAYLADGDELLPARIYLVTPGDAVTFDQGRAHVTAAASEAGAQHTIDHIAASLADDDSLDSILVILSGYGEDGTLGAKRFAELGRKVVAQAVEDAQFPSMPGSIEAKIPGAEMLKAPAIGALLSDFATRAQQSAQGSLPANDTVTQAHLRSITDLLQRELNMDFSDYQPGTLTRRLERRMRMHACPTVEHYLHRFGNDEEELQRLADDFLIGVTRFFRDPEAYAFLKAEVLSELFQSMPGKDEFRVWLVGCSTGEEVYSIASLLGEHIRQQSLNCRLKIFATDVDPAAIAFARAGIYDAQTLSDAPDDIIANCFDAREDGVQIKKALRESIVFATHNVLTDPPFSNLDLLVCRNLLIYLNSQTKHSLLSLFHFALREGGVLFLGCSESIGGGEKHFSALSKKWRIFQSKGHVPQRKPELPLLTRTSSEQPLYFPDTMKSAPSLIGGHNVLRRIMDDQGMYQVMVDSLDRIIFSTGKAESILRLPAGEPTADILSLVTPSLKGVLRTLINRARQEGSALERGPYKLPDDETPLLVWISAMAVRAPGFEDHLIIGFTRGRPMDVQAPDLADQESNWIIDSLRIEVNATREDLQQTLSSSRSSDEVLRRANEEITAMNEELQSSNEELEASKEEMQSLNDELTATNATLENKIKEVAALNDDLHNVFNSTDNATLILDRALRIKRFTPNIVTLMRLRDSDRGRDIEDITHLFDDPEFLSDTRNSVSREAAIEKDITTSDGRVMIRRVLPYRDSHARVAGAVINFIDVTELRASLELDRERARMLRWQSKLLDTAAPIFGLDSEGRITFWNKSAEALWGYTSQEAIGEHAHTLLKTRFSAGQMNAEQILAAEGHWRGVVSQTTKEGRKLDLATSWTATQVNETGDYAVSEVYQDLSATMQLRTALREEQEMFHLLLDWTANAEYWTDEQRNITYITPAVEEITGYSAQSFIDDPDLLDKIVDASAQGEWEHHRSPAQSPSRDEWKSISLPIQRRDGRLNWIEHRFRIIYSSDSSILGFRGTIRDIDEVHRLEGEAERLAYIDPLTGLPNRRALAGKLEDACRAGSRESNYSALIMLDLDHFKLVNDTDGHPVGDLLLVEVGERLKARLRAFDVVARVGGDEFMVILTSLGHDKEAASLAANRICDDLREDIAQAYDLSGSALQHRITCSFGLVLFSGTSSPVDTLMREADLALYAAKEGGRNRVSLFDPTMQAAVDERLRLEHSLRDALQNDGLRLYYQAQTNATGELRGVECLVRYVNAAGEAQGPERFMAVLETQPLVSQIGTWVIETAFKQIAAWQKLPKASDLSLSVNISSLHLLSSMFVDTVRQALEMSGADARKVVFEITENTLLRDVQRIEGVLLDLKELGFRFSLDDFGTGYSSLSHLRTLPISELKIDRSFVAGVTDESSSEALVQSTIAIGEALSLHVIAEGVETQAQIDLLEKMGCHSFQGYLFCKPMPEADFEERYFSTRKPVNGV
jgi:two-component system CheB/CheR fusion protein